MRHLPDVNCIYSVKKCDPKEVQSILNEINVSPDQTLSEVLQNLEKLVLTNEETKIDKNTLDCFEIAIGETILTYKGAKWKKLSISSSGLDGYGILLGDDTVIVPKIMLEDLMRVQKIGTLELYLIGVN